MSSIFKKEGGFTLIELLVTLSIITVILTIILLGQSTYTDKASLTHVADEMGLAFSQAQAYGIGIKSFTPGSSEFSASYGITLSVLPSGSNKAYLSFADRNGNKIYDGNWTCPIGGTSECIERVDMSRGNSINTLCVALTTGTSLCNVGRMDIIFVRPSPEAQMKFYDLSGAPYNPANIKGADIVLQSPKGSFRVVTIYNNGQISVQ